MTIIDELTVDYLGSENWEAPIDGISPNICHSFYPLFFETANVSAKKGDARQQLTFELLGKICSLSLNPQEKNKPFSPFAVFSNGRSTDISDFSDDEAEIMRRIVDLVHQPDLRARLADIIWTREHQNNIGYAETAIDAYLTSGEAQLAKGDDQTYCVKLFTRAANLAASLGRRSDRYNKVILRIDSLIEPLLRKHTDVAGDLIELVLEHGGGDPLRLANFVEICALKAETDRIWYKAGHLWEIKAKCYHVLNDLDGERVALKKLAETYVSNSKDCLAGGQGYSVAAHHIQSAIEVLRRIAGTHTQQEELHKILLDYQKKSLAELKSVSSGTIDLTPEIQSFINNIKDKPFHDALLSFALAVRPVSRKAMASFVDQMAQETPLQALITTNMVDAYGRVVGQRGSMLTGTEQEIARAKETEMFHLANYEQNGLGAILDATRRYLITDHNPALQDFLRIVSYNPFVPPGREILFARGLLSGLEGDFAVALHLLIPQVENSIRYILNQNGVITSSLSFEGIQEEFDLNKTLNMPETAKLFHEDVLFGLQGTLISRFGNNFRNLSAHGLLEYGQYYSYAAVYIWWLILKICCMPLAVQLENTNAAPKE